MGADNSNLIDEMARTRQVRRAKKSERLRRSRKRTPQPRVSAPSSSLGIEGMNPFQGNAA